MAAEKPLLQVKGSTIYLTTFGPDHRLTSDGEVKVSVDDGWLLVEITAPEDRIKGYCVTVNGKSLPIAVSPNPEESKLVETVSPKELHG